MTMKLDLHGYCGKENREAVIQELAHFLRRESLCLFLGSGVSRSAGFPTWLEVAQHCVSKKKVAVALSGKSSTHDLLSALEKVRDACSDDNEFKDLVEEYFLEKVKEYDFEIAKNLLFIALGALVMPSRKGSISEVVTYNFDDMLEWYMHIHGFTTQRITELPFLEKRCDLRIHHPHGYVPLAKSLVGGSPTGERSDRFVFDLYAYECLMANKEDPWNQTLAAIMKRKIPLMVGLSFDDPPLRSLAIQVKQEMEKEKGWSTGGSWRPVGILLKLNKEIDGQEEGCIKRGVAPVGFENYDEIWEFLFCVCQLAAT